MHAYDAVGSHVIILERTSSHGSTYRSLICKFWASNSLRNSKFGALNNKIQKELLMLVLGYYNIGRFVICGSDYQF